MSGFWTAIHYDGPRCPFIPALTGGYKGKWAVDVPGSDKGRGAYRIIYEDTPNGIVLKEIIDYH